MPKIQNDHSVSAIRTLCFFAWYGLILCLCAIASVQLVTGKGETADRHEVVALEVVALEVLEEPGRA
jgi:hypothetical protein